MSALTLSFLGLLSTLSPYENGAIGISIELPNGAIVAGTSPTPPYCLITSDNSSNNWMLRIERGANPDGMTPKELLSRGEIEDEADVARTVLENHTMRAGQVEGWWILEQVDNSDGTQVISGTFAIPASGEQFIVANILTNDVGWSADGKGIVESLGTITLLDPVELLNVKMRGLDLATQRLTSLNQETLQPILGFEEWRRIQMEDEENGSLRDIGYAHIQVEGGKIADIEPRTNQDELIDDGVIVTLRTRILPNEVTGVVTDTAARYWMSWDGKEERWSNRTTQWLEGASSVERETGIRNRPQVGAPKSKILVIKQNRSKDLTQTPFEARAQDPWLPRAFNWILGPLLAQHNQDSSYVWMTYDNNGGVQRVVTRTDRIRSLTNQQWSIETRFGDGEVSYQTTYHDNGHLVEQKQKNGVIISGTTQETLRAIWEPRNLW